MAISGSHVNSHTGTHLGRYPTNHTDIDNAGCIEGEGRATSWQEQEEITTWEQEDRGRPPNQLMPTD